ncbi:micronuclear linker histone polyprotein-like [Cardiocondyla obscurior]|uniref:micronuclear linker histone polyprotein-like n=1 Tax=Cardiocondyla obscurior TaxID=286306 RepID=UPI0039658B95
MQSTDAQEVEQLGPRLATTRRIRQSPLYCDDVPYPGNNQVRDEPMEMDTGAESSHVPASSVTLPPREEWPPAIRPPVQGKSRILTDDDEETLKSKNTTLRRKAANKDKGLEELIDGKLAGPRKHFHGVRPERPHKKHPVPERKIEDKSKKTKKNKGQGPSNVSPLENNKAQPSKKKKDAPPAPSENLQTCSGSTSNPVETPWTKVLGRNAARKNKQVMKPVASTSAPGTITKGAPGIKRGKVEGKKTSSSNTSTKKKRKRRNRRRIPKTSAVVLTCPQKDMPKILSSRQDNSGHGMPSSRIKTRNSQGALHPSSRRRAAILNSRS